MKRILSLILVLLLSFSLCCVCASAEEAASSGNTVSAENAVSAEGAEDRAEGYDVFDLSLSRERIKDAFEKCHLDRKTLKILRMANWNKTDDMLRSELAACIRQHDQLQAEIDSLIPDELKEYFHGQNRTVPGNYKDVFDAFMQEDQQKLYEEKVEAILSVQGEMADCFLELYSRGLYTEAEVLSAIDKLAHHEGTVEEANTVGTQMNDSGLSDTPQPTSTPKPVPAPMSTPAPNSTSTSVSYKDVTALGMIKELNKNAMAAKSNYNGQYVSVTGRLGNIDSDGKYFALEPDTDDATYMFSSIHCTIRTDEVKNQIISINKGDIITVRGKITDVGEVLGYTMNVDDLGEIISGGSIAQSLQPLGSTQSGSYVSVSVTDMLDDMKANALAAKSKYQDQYVSLTGKLGTIDSDGKYFALEPNTDSFDYLWESIHCDMKTDKVKSHIMNLNTGDIITVRGKITDVGEVLGYFLMVDDFG